MSKCREAFEAWWKSNGIELASYAEKAAAKKGWQAAWNARGKVDAEICRAQSNEPECPERAMYCAKAIEK